MRPRLEVCIFGYLGLRRIRRTSAVAKAYWGYFWGHSEFLSCRNLALMRVAGNDVSPVQRRRPSIRVCICALATRRISLQFPATDPDRRRVG